MLVQYLIADHTSLLSRGRLSAVGTQSCEQAQYRNDGEHQSWDCPNRPNGAGGRRDAGGGVH